MKITNIKLTLLNNMALASAFAVAMLLSLLVAVNPAHAVPATNATCPEGNIDVSQGLAGGTACAKPTGAEENLTGEGGVFQIVANILLFLVGAIAVIMLIIGGLRYVTSNGDQNAVTGAKNTIMYAIIGIVVAFLAYAGVNFVVTQLAGSST